MTTGEAKASASEMLLGRQSPTPPAPVAPNENRVFDAAVELAMTNDKFRRDLLKKLKGLSETKKRGNPSTPKHDIQHVRFAVDLIVSYHKQTRGEGWKKKTLVTEAINEAAKLLGLTKKQATSRYYASEKFPD